VTLYKKVSIFSSIVNELTNTTINNIFLQHALTFVNKTVHVSSQCIN